MEPEGLLPGRNVERRGGEKGALDLCWGLVASAAVPEALSVPGTSSAVMVCGWADFQVCLPRVHPKGPWGNEGCGRRGC